MTEPFTRERLAVLRNDAERWHTAVITVDVKELLRLIAMAERLLQVEPVVEAAPTPAVVERPSRYGEE